MGRLGLHFKAVGVRRGERSILHGFEFHLRPGEIVALIGVNGAGKSTAFLAAAGLLPHSGQIQLDGHDLAGLPLYRRAQLGLGYLPQRPIGFPSLTAEKNLQAIAELTLKKSMVKQRVDALLASFDLMAHRTRQADSLSGGERRRLDLARLLITDPQVLLLDEPFAALDQQSADIIIGVLQKRARAGTAILVADHRLQSVLRLSQRLLILSEGAIAFDGPCQGEGVRSALETWYAPKVPS